MPYELSVISYQFSVSAVGQTAGWWGMPPAPKLFESLAVVLSAGSFSVHLG